MQLEIDGLNIAYDDRGEGRPILLLHGWGGSSASFAPVADFLAAQGFRAVSIDFPGHGLSGEPPKPWSVTEYAALTKKFIDALGLYGCGAVAHSFGGRVAIYLSSEYRDIFSRQVFTDAAGIRPRRKLRYYVKVYTYKLGKKLSKVNCLRRALKLDEKLGNAGSADYRALSGVMRGTFSRVVNQDLTPRLKQIAIPTLLVWGDQDGETPLYMAHIMEKQIKDAGLVVFEGAGHFSYLDYLGRYCAVLASFFGGE
ncbi:hypothetical protein SDC9_137321 [bioreactor metagenome]|uniref:AB hydrolase-1 domain-containing protein n=1 Tax=bioreactor metagenome TaxID=1076179 RepID=A0A645DL81_9ZZZZ